MKNVIVALGGFGLLAAAAGASALQYDLTGSGMGAYVAACGTNTSADCQLSFGSGAETLKARAYSTDNPIPSLLGNLIGADLHRYSGGIGVRNLDEAEGSGAPEHASDNQDRFDVIVFEAPSDNFNWQSIALGWAEERASPYTAVEGRRADLQFYVGGTGANKDFTTMCYTGCAAANSIQDLTSGFKSLGQIGNIAEGSSAALPANSNGRYLVVSGALDGGNLTNFADYFKVSSIKGVPEPQVLALLGFGLLAMLGVFRSRRIALA